jgi:hypothetical protein
MGFRGAGAGGVRGLRSGASGSRIAGTLIAFIVAFASAGQAAALAGGSTSAMGSTNLMAGMEMPTKASKVSYASSLKPP